MRLDRVALGIWLAGCSFDGTGLDATSVTANATASTTGSESGTIGETPTTGPDDPVDTTIGAGMTEPIDATGDPPTGGTSSTSTTDPPACGDGRVDPGEDCDDGNDADDDACVGACQPARCGDGLVWVGMEACDDGDTDELACTDQCQLPACDDGAKNGDETDVDCGGGCPGCEAGQACGDDDDCVGNCADGACVAFASCRELKEAVPEAASGVYAIDPDQGGPEPAFDVYCEQDHDGGGWTMVLKVDGRTKTFVYSAPLWTDGNTLNPDPALDRSETKLQSFNTVPLTELLLGIEAPIAEDGPLKLEYLELAATGASARALFMPGTLMASQLGRSAWKGWITDSSLQMHCNREGLNVQADGGFPQNYARVRIGIIGNENGAMDCSTPNSYIGVGGGGTGACVLNGITTTGNRAGCGADEGEQDLPGFAVVFVR